MMDVQHSESTRDESFGKTENPEGDDFSAKNYPAITSGGYLKGGHNASRHLRLPRRQ